MDVGARRTVAAVNLQPPKLSKEALFGKDRIYDLKIKKVQIG